MKRIITLALAACMVLGAAFSASAVEIKGSGEFFILYDSFKQDNAPDTNKFYQRFRPQIDVIASENLRATFQFQIAQTWGTNTPGGSSNPSSYTGTTGANYAGAEIVTRRAYLSFDLPFAPIAMTAGLQGFATPNSGYGSAIIDTNIAAITATYAVDNFAVTGVFGRLQDLNKKNSNPAALNQIDNNARTDLYGVLASADLGVVALQPYFLYTNSYTSAAGSPNDVSSYWTGLVAKSAFEGFDFGGEVIYGSRSFKNAATQNGWLVSANAGYTLDFARVGLMGWYATSTSSANTNGMPTIGNDKDFGPTIIFGGGMTHALSTHAIYSTMGTRALVLSASDISFIEKLSHNVALGYVVADNTDLKGKVWEVDVTNAYQMYEQLELFFDFAYANVNPDGVSKNNDILKFAAGVEYNF